MSAYLYSWSSWFSFGFFFCFFLCVLSRISSHFSESCWITLVECQFYTDHHLFFSSSILKNMCSLKTNSFHNVIRIYIIWHGWCLGDKQKIISIESKMITVHLNNKQRTTLFANNIWEDGKYTNDIISVIARYASDFYHANSCSSSSQSQFNVVNIISILHLVYIMFAATVVLAKVKALNLNYSIRLGAFSFRTLWEIGLHEFSSNQSI